MLLLDASVWIDLLRGNDNGSVRYAMEREPFEDLALTPMTYLEVLQGARSDAEMGQMASLLQAYALLEPAAGLDTYEAAARMYMTARRRGVTIRTAVDCLVAAVAIEHGAVLVHNDRDFLALQRVDDRLQLYPAGVAH
ncbi:MAG: PIN domain nuclease [Burkholderiales bacterium]|nr:PIN domain nuclease [Burkholderiales bacterium]